VAPAVASCYRAQLLNVTLPGGILGDVHRGVLHELPSPVRDAWPSVLVVLAFLAAAVTLAVRHLAPAHPRSWAARVRRVVREDVRGILMVRRAWLGILIASTVALGFHLATYFLAARAVGVTASAATLLPVALLVFLAAGLPVNLAGWGPREGMAAWSFGAVGLGAEQGVATAVAFGAIVLVANLPGAIVLLAGSARRHRPRRPAPTPALLRVAEERAAHG
jgi:glycosyltransferase 2 family protein